MVGSMSHSIMIQCLPRQKNPWFRPRLCRAHPTSFLRVIYDAAGGQWLKSTYIMPIKISSSDQAITVLINRAHFSGNHVLNPVYNPNNEEILILVFAPLTKEIIPQDLNAMRLRCISKSHGENTSHRKLVAGAYCNQYAIHKFGLQYAWVKEANQNRIIVRVRALSRARRHKHGFKICGNPNFVILFGSKGYVV